MSQCRRITNHLEAQLRVTYITIIIGQSLNSYVQVGTGQSHLDDSKVGAGTKFLGFVVKLRISWMEPTHTFLGGNLH